MTVALVGISGVGKTTFLKTAMSATPFLHLEASKLIKEEIALLKKQVQTSEELRIGAIMDNQKLLVKAFRRKTVDCYDRVVLDAHTVVDTGNSLEKIPASVFLALNVKSILFLQDDPKTIRARREADKSRKRPQRTVDEIEHHQQMAILAAANVALELEISLHVITSRQANMLAQALQV